MRASPPTTWLARPSTMAGRVAPAMGLGHSQWWAGAFASPPNPTPRPAHPGDWAVGAAPQHTSHRYAPKPELLRLNHVSASTFKRKSLTFPRFLPHVAREGN